MGLGIPADPRLSFGSAIVAEKRTAWKKQRPGVGMRLDGEKRGNQRGMARLANVRWCCCGVVSPDDIHPPTAIRRHHHGSDTKSESGWVAITLDVTPCPIPKHIATEDALSLDLTSRYHVLFVPTGRDRSTLRRLPSSQHVTTENRCMRPLYIAMVSHLGSQGADNFVQAKKKRRRHSEHDTGEPEQGYLVK